VTVTNSPKQKDELILEGNNIEDVSRSGKDYSAKCMEIIVNRISSFILFVVSSVPVFLHQLIFHYNMLNWEMGDFLVITLSRY
jgi:hypothetical protein